jgi:hypothetical protein
MALDLLLMFTFGHFISVMDNHCRHQAGYVFESLCLDLRSSGQLSAQWGIAAGSVSCPPRYPLGEEELGMSSLFADLRIILRQLRRSPGFAITAIATVALGVGANSVVFSVLNALLLRPLALHDSSNLYFLERPESPNNSYLDYRDLHDRNSTFSGLAAFRIGAAGIDLGTNPSLAWLYEVTGNYFDVAGEQPFLGRFFHPSDEQGENASPLVVLSNAYCLGAMLAITGIFGMASCSVSRRLRELGIRIALGAQRREVLKAALGRCTQLLTIGSAVGLLLGVAASRVLAFVVYQASSQDPLVLGGVVVAMALLGLLAAWVPARRAISINPAILMREQ